MNSKEKKEASEIPLPLSKLLLFDLDKTLIDSDYQITDQEIFFEIQRVQSLGWTLGLNSDSPLKTMQEWKKKLGLNGPLIAERGAIVWLPDGTEIKIKGIEEFFTSTKLSIIARLVIDCIPFVYGNATEFIRSRPMLPVMCDNRLILIQNERKCGIGLYGRKITENGQLIIDNELTVQAIDIVRSTYSTPPFDLLEDFNPEYGIFLLSARHVNKRLGVSSLLSQLGIEKVGMIGDSDSDILGSDFAIQYAVANAKESLKKSADFVASSNYTSGVIEILSYIR